jgi:TldD protein
MDIRFPRGLFCDVRIEDVFLTGIKITLGTLDDFLVREYSAAFIRVYDGRRWFFGSTSDIGAIQKQVDLLASMATANELIDDDPVVARLHSHKGEHLVFGDRDVASVDRKLKLALLESCIGPVGAHPRVTSWTASYSDGRKRKRIISSKGADITFDSQSAGMSVGFQMAQADRRFGESAWSMSEDFGKLGSLQPMLEEKLAQAEDCLLHAEPIEPGEYPVILSPLAAGIFAHESFGHKSEADFMVGDETMMREWAMGTKVGVGMLSIVDDGSEHGTGYTPFDDEGTKACKTWLVRDGVLSGRLHSSSTAAALDEEATGNARSVNFEYQPIPRMTTTYILPGKSTFDDLVSGIDRGLLVETIKHGSGLSTFTLAPNTAHWIRGGRVAEPVNASVISGNVMETLGLIDGLSDKLELLSLPGGGCGKNEQYPLPVGFGGPWVRVSRMNVR